ncbi:MAG: hypothetical protein CVU87_01990 [Firmicutes bacterium HGW-Firmicutes-12]|nr:MAG: hypothetical protein CVU87_01990 [Firmicutes bacterium HGW-Firmicutes-12]
MKNIFVKEEQVVEEAEKLLSAKQFTGEEDAQNYGALLAEYKSLLNQMIKVVKISDIMQSELKTMSDNFEETSRIDVLTGIYNRRYFNESYLREWKNAVRTKTYLAVLMLDIDYFKNYNDTYGHLQGDECLKAVAKGIQQAIKRPRDIVTRYGGDEFVVLLPETEAKGATCVAQTIIDNIESLALEHSGSPINHKVTVSIGVSSIIPDKSIKKVDSLLSIADTALYMAKEQRNCFKLLIR